ncbi:hypothetical protein [Glaciecola sp. SC05]|uniref:hypothetical protein n=1 Tax=Glaciecola sp. SC05 TaxID=1987355 RepID=UPI0035284AC2
MKLFIIFTILVLVTACSDVSFSSPSCRVAKSERQNIKPTDPNVQAACVIKAKGRLLTIQRDSGLYDLAYSQKRSTDMENNCSNAGQITTAQCFAHQAMWQQTGFNVEVGQLLTTQIDGSLLYACDLQAGFDGSEDAIEAPPWHPENVQKIVFIYPFDIELDQWQHPDHFASMRDAFVLSEEISEIPLINTSD